MGQKHVNEFITPEELERLLLKITSYVQSGMYDDEKDGQLISIEDAKKYVGNKKNWQHKGKQEVVSIRFRPYVFIKLLAQEGCDSIRIYLAKNPNNENTLVMTAIDIDDHDLEIENKYAGEKTKSIITAKLPDDAPNPLIVEAGGGDRRGDFTEYP